MPKFVGFKKIGQFRQVIGDIKHATQYRGVDDDGNLIMDRTAKLPTITFKGTVKLHGTNAGVAQGGDGEIWYQSRKNVITPEKDNAGFAFFADTNKEIFEVMFEKIRERTDIEDTIVIFGEWCGGNIQKGVAISGLDKMFVIFAVKVATDNEEEANYYLDESVWEDLSWTDNRIYNINDFPSWTVDIDFNQPEASRNEMIDIMAEVEKECPVGKAFGRGENDEDNTTGEGNVWKAFVDGVCYMFKVKGEKHSASKVKTLAPIDTEKLNSINEFVDYAVTENRLNQGIEQVFTIESKDPEIKFTGDFIKWVVGDVIAEEKDTLASNGLEPKDVGKYLSNKARIWFHDYLNTQAGL